MKVLILAALVATISAGWFDSDWTSGDKKVESLSHTEWQSGKEYVYKYESQVLTSLPTFTKSHGGVKIVSMVKLDFVSTSQVVMQMTDIQVLSLNHEIGNPADLPPVHQLPVDKFTPLPSSHLSLVTSKLQMPIKFRYEDGKVTSIEISDKETNWSVDVKRSILSMLQVRLQADKSSSNPKLGYNKLSTDKPTTTFSFLEPALDGTCYSELSVSPLYQPQMQKNAYKILKSRDPVNCQKLNTIYKVTWPQHISRCDCMPNLDNKQCKCEPTAEERRRANPAYFNAKTLSEYEVVSGDQKNLLIKNCMQSATYRYEFPNYPQQYLATFSNQTLKLTQQKDDLSIDTKPFSFKTISEPWKQQVLEHEDEQLMMTPEQVVQKAKSLIGEMAKITTKPSRFEDHLTVFYQLQETLKLCKSSELERIYREYDVKQHYRDWKILVDALAHCNTTVCDEFLMEKIVSGVRNFPPTESTSIFFLWAQDKVPTIPVLDKFSQTVIPSLERDSEQKMAYHHSLLAFGAMVRRFIHSEEMNKRLGALEKDKLLHQNNIDYCRKYEKVLEGKLSSADVDEKKIATLKAMANLGSLKSLPQLQNMMSRSESTAVRVHAVYALKNLCFQNRLQVLQTLTPLLKDINEDSEVRMAAFTIYMTCDPSTTQLHKIIEQEQDIDLKTFFVQSLKNMLKTAKISGDRKRAQKIKLVLSKIKVFRMSADSGSTQLRFAFKPDTDGAMFNFEWLTNQTSPIPRAARIELKKTARGVPQQIIEIGFRAEGFESLFAQLKEKSSSQQSHPDMGILQSLIPKSRDWKDLKPTVSLYIKANGQNIAFVYVDTDTINKHLLEGVRKGQIEIPIRFFQTFVTKPEQNKKLQPSGMWHVSERVDMGVLDMDGTLIIRKPGEGELMPNISFGSEKLFRHEIKSMLSQYVKCGYLKTGVTSAVGARRYISEQMWNVSYSFSQKNMTFNVSNPSKEILMMEMEAYTNTFVLPMRLPQIIKEKKTAFKDVQTHDPERLTFNREIKALRSVELKAQVEGDVCLPELYSYLRNNLVMLPSVPYMKKQHIRFTIQPATSSPRKYTFTQSVRDFHNEMSSFMSEQKESHRDASVSSEEEDEKKWGFIGGWFSSSSSESSSASDEIRSISSDNYDPLKQLRVGSIRRLWQGQIRSQSDRRILSMVANLTTQYEHDQPSVHYALSASRPPIPSEEREDATLDIVGTRIFNPAINQIITKGITSWGPKSNPMQHTIKVTEEETAMYKDNVCYEQSTYGCQDQYGVVYPLNYNKATVFESKNTDLVERMLRALKPFYANFAERTTVYPAGKPVQNKLNITRIFRTFEDKVDVAFTLDGERWNMSKVFLPVERSLEEVVNIRPMYPMGNIRRVSQYSPAHEWVHPFFSRDKCVVDNTKVRSMDLKQLLMPKSDCEVVLLGDCARQNHQLLVSLKSDVSDRAIEKKILKMILGSTKVEIAVNAPTSYTSSAVKVKVNGQQQYLDNKKPFVVKQQNVPVAVLECDKNQCEIKSTKHGVYVRVNSDSVKVEVEQGRSRFFCGLCSAHPELRSGEADYSQSVQIFNNNRDKSQKCSVEERPESARQFLQQQKCDKHIRHKMSYVLSGDQLKACVTTSTLPMCCRHCSHKSVSVSRMPARCISLSEAHRLGLSPTMEGDEMYLDEERLLSRMRNAERRDVLTSYSQHCE